MEIFTDDGTIKDTDYLSIEWDAQGDDVDEGAGIGVWIENKEIVDYDGVFELPSQLINWLKELGINTEYAEV